MTAAFERGGSADESGRLITIHPRHLDIHKNCVADPAFHAEEPVHSLLAIPRATDLRTRHFQYLHSDLKAQVVVLHYKDSSACEPPHFL